MYARGQHASCFSFHLEANRTRTGLAIEPHTASITIFGNSLLTHLCSIDEKEDDEHNFQDEDQDQEK